MLFVSWRVYTYCLDLEVPYDKVRMNSGVLQSDCYAGVLLGALVGPVLCAFHLGGGREGSGNTPGLFKLKM